MAFLTLWGCSERPGGDHYENEPPQVWLASAPPSGAETGYKIHLFWGGWDPDGDIAYYEYCITDNRNGIFNPADTVSTPGDSTSAGRNPWRRVWGNDSIFVFSADELVDSNTTNPITKFQRSHTFLIRSVDEEGLPSVEVAHRSFTAWTLSPSIYITVPGARPGNSLLVAPVSTFQWRATDYLQDLEKPLEPDSVRWMLRAVDGTGYGGAINYIRTHPNAPDWYPWYPYDAEGDSGHFWTTPPVDLGSYVFAVQAKDEAGAVTPVFDEYYNVRRLRVEQRNAGPQLNVFNEYIGTVRSSNPNPSVVIVDLPSSIPIQFTITASADYYGGLVTGYRYGWDVLNLSNPDEWEIDVTPFTDARGDPTAKTVPRTFYFGTHTFDVEVYDHSGLLSRVEIKVNVIPFSMERSLLLVDDFEPTAAGIFTTRGEMPNDEEHDAFWESMLSDVAGFNFSVDQLPVKHGEPLSITRIAPYRSIIWDAKGGYDVNIYAIPKLYDIIKY
ncbi:MAG TPA: hypothetical protein ENO14_03305, partial [Chromatiales bacterium]|nr:hypothetical protein [Chromatiales bacterium]